MSTKQKILTPLGIIALFISLSEMIAGVVLTQVTGSIQIILTIFVIVFPILISLMFFYVLWHRPQVFYHPKEYGKETDVTTFSKAMERRFESAPSLSRNIENQIHNSITDKSKADLIIEKIRKSDFIEIDTHPILGDKGEVVRVPYQEFESVGLLLRYIWFEVGNLKTHSYNIEWCLKDEGNNKMLTKIGSVYARDNLGTHWDERPLEKVGIHPGSILSVQLL